ncbi:MFS transporter [Actinomadura sp. NAK00032]|uniref:MFS transporter n=1 Tax=Actinomadura sp. NAK00032 TaxID=2742128 RepID=UPI001592149D|nr:MFS transporter [Actinomadura sp. NAK00032]QKW33481.1 MFS transporter [Actinomadura sp. NAK00032]
MSDRSGAGAAIAGRMRTAALLAILLATFMDLMDVTILYLVLPSIATDLGAGPAAVEWMSVGYTLALALGLITGARAGDRLGYKRVFLGGMVGFVAASALCGAAVTPGMLVAARVLQGLFAAAMVPQVLSQIQVMYAPAERGPAMAAYSALTPLAAAVGTVLGPVLLVWDLAGAGWRLVFFVNVAVGLVTLPIAWRLLPEARAARAARFDLAGVGICTAGLVLLLYPLITAADRPHWPAWATASMAAGLAVLAGFAVHQRRLAARGGDPLLRVGLLRIRSLSGGLLVQALFLTPIIGFFLVFLQFLQFGLGHGALRAGLTLLPWSIVVAVFAGVSAAVLLPRIGRAAVQIGLVVNAIGLALLALAAADAAPGTGWAELLPGILVGAAGMGLVVSPVAALTFADLPPAEAGSGSGLFGTTSQLGASAGVALMGTVFFARVREHGGAGRVAFGDALAVSLWVGIGLLGLALAASFLLPRHSPEHQARARGRSGDEPATSDGNLL